MFLHYEWKTLSRWRPRVGNVRCFDSKSVWSFDLRKIHAAIRESSVMVQERLLIPKSMFFSLQTQNDDVQKPIRPDCSIQTISRLCSGFPRFLDTIFDHPDIQKTCFREIRFFVAISVTIAAKWIRNIDEDPFHLKDLEQNFLMSEGCESKSTVLGKLMIFLDQNSHIEVLGRIGRYGVDLLFAAYCKESLVEFTIEAPQSFHRNFINHCLREFTNDVSYNAGQFSIQFLNSWGDMKAFKTFMEKDFEIKICDFTVPTYFNCPSCEHACVFSEKNLEQYIVACDQCAASLCERCNGFCRPCIKHKEQKLIQMCESLKIRFEEDKEELKECRSNLDVATRSLSIAQRENEEVCSENEEKTSKIASLSKLLDLPKKGRSDKTKKDISNLEQKLKDCDERIEQMKARISKSNIHKFHDQVWRMASS